MQGKPPDWQDFVGIIALLLINSTISFIEENNAGNAAAALMASLAPQAKVLHLANSFIILSDSTIISASNCFYFFSSSLDKVVYV